MHLLLLQLKMALDEELDLITPHAVEVGMSQTLDSCESLILYHAEHARHEI